MNQPQQIERTQRAWWCPGCHATGPWYGIGDPTILAGWAVHERNCTVLAEGKTA